MIGWGEAVVSLRDFSLGCEPKVVGLCGVGGVFRAAGFCFLKRGRGRHVSADHGILVGIFGAGASTAVCRPKVR